MTEQALAGFVTAIELRRRDLDLNGHVSHLAYLEIAEIARVRHLEACGIAPERLVTLERAVIVLELQVRWLREVRGQAGRVDCTSAFAATGGKTMRHMQVIRLEGAEVCTLEFTAGLLDLQARRLRSDPIDELNQLMATGAAGSAEDTRQRRYSI